MNQLHHQHRPPGFTLVELVLVMLILAILATAALNVVDVRVDQTRFESTQQTLKDLETAIVGSANARAADGTRIVSGFVADVGRLPISIEELLAPPNNVPAFQVFRSDGNAAVVATEVPSDQDITAVGGWNGPYLQLPVAASALTDGWNHPFNFLTEDGNLTTGNELIGIVRSNGRDGLIGGVTTYDSDLVLSVSANVAVPGVVASPNDLARGFFVANIFDGNIGVIPNDPNNDIVIRVYGPVQTDPINNPDVVAIQTVYHEIFGDDPAEVIDGVTAVSFTAELFVGPRIIRAYEIDGMFAPAADDDLSVNGVNTANILARSSAVPITISNEVVPISLIMN
ncbi:MAG: prepilin-type N-terminal cleavage/methylation domain-containing protein [Planctomycetota bacterium]